MNNEILLDIYDRQETYRNCDNPLGCSCNEMSCKYSRVIFDEQTIRFVCSRDHEPSFIITTPYEE